MVRAGAAIIATPAALRDEDSEGISTIPKQMSTCFPHEPAPSALNYITVTSNTTKGTSAFLDGAERQSQENKGVSVARTKLRGICACIDVAGVSDQPPITALTTAGCADAPTWGLIHCVSTGGDAWCACECSTRHLVKSKCGFLVRLLCLLGVLFRWIMADRAFVSNSAAASPVKPTLARLVAVPKSPPPLAAIAWGRRSSVGCPTYPPERCILAHGKSHNNSCTLSLTRLTILTEDACYGIKRISGSRHEHRTHIFTERLPGKQLRQQRCSPETLSRLLYNLSGVTGVNRTLSRQQELLRKLGTNHTRPNHGFSHRHTCTSWICSTYFRNSIRSTKGNNATSAVNVKKHSEVNRQSAGIRSRWPGDSNGISYNIMYYRKLPSLSRGSGSSADASVDSVFRPTHWNLCRALDIPDSSGTGCAAVALLQQRFLVNGKVSFYESRLQAKRPKARAEKRAKNYQRAYEEQRKREQQQLNQQQQQQRRLLEQQEEAERQRAQQQKLSGKEEETGEAGSAAGASATLTQLMEEARVAAGEIIKHHENFVLVGSTQRPVHGRRPPNIQRYEKQRDFVKSVFSEFPVTQNELHTEIIKAERAWRGDMMLDELEAEIGGPEALAPGGVAIPTR